MFDISNLSPNSKRILKDLCPVPDGQMMPVRKNQYDNISLEEFYSVLHELDASGLVTFMKKPTAFTHPINEIEENKKSNHPFLMKIKHEYKGLCEKLR